MQCAVIWYSERDIMEVDRWKGLELSVTVRTLWAYKDKTLLAEEQKKKCWASSMVSDKTDLSLHISGFSWVQYSLISKASV